MHYLYNNVELWQQSGIQFRQQLAEGCQLTRIWSIICLQYAVYDAVAAYAWDIQDEVQEYHQILGRLGAFEQRLLYVLGETTVCISRDYCMYVASSYCTSTLHAHLALQTEQHYHA